MTIFFVIPAKAGIYALRWTPVFAGMTDPYLNHLKRNTTIGSITPANADESRPHYRISRQLRPQRREYRHGRRRPCDKRVSGGKAHLRPTDERLVAS